MIAINVTANPITIGSFGVFRLHRSASSAREVPAKPERLNCSAGLAQEREEMTYRLGKKPPRHDDRTMLFQEFKGSLPPAPAAADFMSKVPSWPMFLNDTESDCAEVAMAHQQMGWTWYAGKVSFRPWEAFRRRTK